MPRQNTTLGGPLTLPQIHLMQGNPEMQCLWGKALQASGRHNNGVTLFLLSPTDQTKDAAACAHCEGISKSEGGHTPS